MVAVQLPSLFAVDISMYCDTWTLQNKWKRTKEEDQWIAAAARAQHRYELEVLYGT